MLSSGHLAWMLHLLPSFCFLCFGFSHVHEYVVWWDMFTDKFIFLPQPLLAGPQIQLHTKPLETPLPVPVLILTASWPSSPVLPRECPFWGWSCSVFTWVILSTVAFHSLVLLEFFLSWNFGYCEIFKNHKILRKTDELGIYSKWCHTTSERKKNVCVPPNMGILFYNMCIHICKQMYV